MYKSLATSLTTFAFIVMGLTGVLMYFHILDNYTKDGIISAVSLGFILTAPTGPNVKRILFNSVLQNPIEKTSVLFVDSYDIAKKRLEDAGLIVEADKSIKELSMINQTSPFVIIDTILKK